MKICLALAMALVTECGGVNNLGRGAPLAIDRKGHMTPVIHAAAATAESHVTAKAVASHKASASAVKIVPPLVDVDTDKKFFGPPFPADYPDDISPPVKGRLFRKDSVYPKVQEEGFFDKDYVKDENSDGGKWQAQYDYDAARTKIYNQKRQVENAKKRAENEAHDVADAAKQVKERQQKENAAADAAKTAGEEATSAAERAKERAKEREEKRAAAEAAEAQAKAEEEKHQGQTREEMEKKVKEAEEALEREKESYKNCLKQLQEAKARVAELEKQRDRLEREGVDTTKTVVAERGDLEHERKALEEARKAYEAAEMKHQAAERSVEVAHGEKDEAQRELEKQKAENAGAQAAVEREKQRAAELENDLAKARENLRRIRGADAPPAGEATPAPKKAGAPGMSMSLAVAVVSITGMAF